MKKRIFALFLSVLIVFSFTACKEEKINEDVSVETDDHFGDVSSTGYTSGVFGIDAHFDEDWIVYNENEILEYNGFTAEDIISEDDIKPGDSFAELVAYDIDSEDSVIVYSEKLTAGKDLDLNTIVEDKKAEQEEYLAYCDYTDIESEVSVDEFFGEDRTCLKISAILDGENLYTSYIYALTDNYLITFVITSDSDEGLDNILSKIELK